MATDHHDDRDDGRLVPAGQPVQLGALADLLSRPILSGLLNGVAITIIVDQIGKVLGFTVRPAQLIERIYALPGNLLHSDWLTMAVSLLTLVTLLGFKNGGLTGRRRCLPSCWRRSSPGPAACSSMAW